MCLICIGAIKAQDSQIDNAEKALSNEAVQVVSDNEQTENTNDDRSVVEKIKPIGNDYQNSITLLNNRFRIDDGVEKVVMIFFREFGAKPVVLVRPDGSKLYLDNDQRDDSYHWFESDTYDMIELVNPMPGPWQALGQILPGSEILVIANLTLEAEPVPSPIFSGETIKQTARLLNAGEEVNFKEIRDVVALTIDFISTNHPDHENFGLGTKNVARFEDNGMGLDESAGDGVFTGEYDLDIAHGEWLPIFSVRTPLFSREITADTTLLLPNPVSTSHTLDEGEGGFHTILFTLNSELIDPKSLLVEGTVRSPQGETERFALTDIGDYERKVTVVNSAYGIYRIKVKAFAQTMDGRDIILRVPEYTFVTSPPVVEEVPIDTPVITAQELIDAPVEAEEESSIVIYVVLINAFLLVCGSIVIFLIADKRRNPENHILKLIKAKFSNIRIGKKVKDENAE